mmetsp:Transcript_36210/g.103033  ORF Transcript_36210/g.103033 Transcript_36210/m.103033 type:complete len:219 (+) Transcript_36210:863-1519(+)
MMRLLPDRRGKPRGLILHVPAQVLDDVDARAQHDVGAGPPPAARLRGRRRLHRLVRLPKGPRGLHRGRQPGEHPRGGKLEEGRVPMPSVRLPSAAQHRGIEFAVHVAVEDLGGLGVAASDDHSLEHVRVQLPPRLQRRGDAVAGLLRRAGGEVVHRQNEHRLGPRPGACRRWWAGVGLGGGDARQAEQMQAVHACEDVLLRGEVFPLLADLRPQRVAT